MSLAEVPELTFWQKLQLAFTGQVFLRVQLLDGHTAISKIFVAKCCDHGLFLASQHGYDDKLTPCPDCMSMEVSLADLKLGAFH